VQKVKNIKYTLRLEKNTLFFDHVHIYCQNQLTLHQQDSWELSYVITGRGVRVIGDITEPFREGEVILIPPNIPHCWTFDQSVHDDEGKIENITITFPKNLLQSIIVVFPELTEIIAQIQSNINAISFSGKTLAELQIKMKAMKTETDIERVVSLFNLFQILASVKDRKNVVGRPIIEDKKSRKIQNIYLYVMNNYQENITLEEIARFSGMEKSSFCIFFKKQTGQSFFSYLTEYRVSLSCEILRKTTKTISEICIASGFRDIPYYNRVFKKLVKKTPSEYRKGVNSGKIDL